MDLPRLRSHPIESRFRYVDHVQARGADRCREACRRDLEGVVVNWEHGPYHTDAVQTSWLKIKNPGYSQMAGRRELFERRRDRITHSRRRSFAAPILSLTS